MRLKRTVVTIAALLSLPTLAATAPRTAPGPAHKPQRVMSMMLCSDQLAMMLLEPQRISSITYVSLNGGVSPALDAEARRLRINHGLAEEVLAEKPDLIVAGTSTTPMTRKLAKRMGISLIELPPANSFQDIRDQMRLLGDAFGDRPRAEAWIAHMDATLAKLARTAPERRIAAVGWSGDGRVAGRDSLFNAILEAAGGYNQAAAPGASERTVDLEQLLSTKPQPEVLLYGVSANIRTGQQVDLVQHPVLARAFGKRRLAYPQGPFTCGSPYAANEAVALRRVMLAVARPGAAP